MNVLISVITAVFNDEKFIKQSVESILNQTHRDFEYVIVDDGSTDNTLYILKEIAQKDERVILVTQKNTGAATARNLAISIAKGLYIAIQDSDDISSPDRLKTQLEQLLKSRTDLISCSGFKVIDTDDKVIAINNKIYKNINKNILNGSFCAAHPTIMLRKELVVKAGLYNPFYNKTEDYDLIFRLLENGARFEKINECLCNYRLRENSEGSMNNGAYTKRVYENHLNRIRSKPENFTNVINDYKTRKSSMLERQAHQVFYSENYGNYVRLYLKNFKSLPIRYFVYFFFSALPPFLKKALKTVNNS